LFRLEKAEGVLLSSAQMEQVSAVDVGTNSIRLLIAPRGAAGRPTVTRRRITRLGASLESHGIIGPAEWRESLSVLGEYFAEMARLGVISYRAGGTAALRKAENATKFIQDVFDRTGLVLEVLSEEEEARLSLAGVLGAVTLSGDSSVVFDVGGGSTEFICTRNGRPVAIQSTGIGAVTLTHRFLHGEDPPSPTSVQRLEDFLHHELSSVAAWVEEHLTRTDLERNGLVGTAGTMASLAAMLQELKTYDPSRINDYRMERRELERLTRRLIRLKSDKRALLPGMEPGRVDIIVAGALVVIAVMEVFRADVVVAADAGLLEGLLLSIS
jgi:exopolyphosphatase/guanosine-5'-triphosphate,3'-diphosphate pyrophosphatase